MHCISRVHAHTQCEILQMAFRIMLNTSVDRTLGTSRSY